MDRFGSRCSTYEFLRNNEIYGDPQPEYLDSKRLEYISQLSASDLNKFFVEGPNGERVPPLIVKFCNADEAGNLYIFSSAGSATGRPMKPKATWQAHKNSIFDVIWSLDDEQLVSASGDLNAAVWDAESQKLICVFVGHSASIKCISANPRNKCEYATCSRDGSIMFWDTRCTGETNFGEYHQRPVDRIGRAHDSKDHEASTKKVCPDLRKLVLPFLTGTSTQTRQGPHAVTCICFISDRFIVSGGATDGIIKMWDMRFMGGGYGSSEAPSPYAASEVLGSSGYPHGVSSMTINPGGERIFVTCLNSKIYEFNSSDISEHTKIFSSDSYRCKSFYVKSTISPDGRFLATGSSSQKIHLWNLSDPLIPPVTIEGHTEEVTGISWSPCLLGQLATCSDDYSIRIWNVPAYFRIPILYS